MNLGLSKTDAEVYTFLATKGPQKTQTIMEELKLQEQPLYRSLEILRNKGIISMMQEHSTSFIASPFDKVLELLVKEQLKQAQVIEQSKDEILSEWKNKIKNYQNTTNH